MNNFKHSTTQQPLKSTSATRGMTKIKIGGSSLIQMGLMMINVIEGPVSCIILKGRIRNVKLAGVAHPVSTVIECLFY